MTEITKICRVHGELTLENIYRKGVKNQKGDPHYACRLCKLIQAKKYDDAHRDKIREKQKIYDAVRRKDPEFRKKKRIWARAQYKAKRKNNLDRLRAKEKEWQQRYRDNNKDQYNKRMESYREELTDSYVKSYLKREFGFDNPSDALIGLKRNLIKLKRHIYRNRSRD